MPAGGPAPGNTWEPRAGCPTQPKVSLKALEPEAAPPTTMQPQHALANLADQPPLPSAGSAPSRHLIVPATANAPPLTGPGIFHHTRSPHLLLPSFSSRPRPSSPHPPDCLLMLPVSLIEPHQIHFSLLLSCDCVNVPLRSVHCVGYLMDTSARIRRPFL